MTKEELLRLMDCIRQEVLEIDEMKNAPKEAIDEAIMDTLFEGFQQGELHRTDLKMAAEIMGFEISEEFMNDPHPDPIDLKGK